MNKLFSTLFSSIRAKFTSLWTKVRLWTSPIYWQSQIFTRVRQFFSRLFDVRPRHKSDYYGVFNWLVSKRLAFALVVVIGVLCGVYLYITLPKGFFTGTGATVRTYRYNAIPLKFYSGSVRILAADGHLAYEGQVKDAHCVGQGTLYNKEGAKVYEGAFADDMYNGEGTLYYPEGMVQYQGNFLNNLFQGQGSYYRPSGAVEYEGAYESGYRNGQGTLYNAAANSIFTGTFQMGEILYSQFLDKSTSEVSQMYTGKTQVYSSSNEYAVSMDEIGAVYAANDGSNTLDGEWTVGSVYVLSDQLPIEGETLTTINQLTAHFGQPDYYGVSWVDLSEAVAINLLAQEDPLVLGEVSITTSSEFDGVYTVSNYDQDFQVYIYTYIQDGLLYTFYTTGSASERFVMYSIQTT